MQFTGEGIQDRSEHYFLRPSAFALDNLYYVQSLGRFEVTDRYRVTRLNYDSFLLMCVTVGTIRCHVNDEVCVAHAGDVLLVDCHHSHEYQALTDSVFFFMHFGGSASSALSSAIISQSGLCLHPQQDLSVLIEKLLPRSGDALDETFVSSCVYAALMTLLASSGPKRLTVSGRPDITEAMRYIQQHLSEPLTAQALSRRFGYSQAVFSRHFRACAGFSPYQFILRCRIDHSKHLLSNTELHIQ